MQWYSSETVWKLQIQGKCSPEKVKEMTILMIIAEIYNYIVYSSLGIIKFDSDYTKGPEIIDL